MKKFLLQFFYFSLIPLLFTILVEISISLFRNSIFSEKRLEKLFLNEIADYDWIKSLESDSIYVLAGSSTVKYSLSCSQLNELNPDSNRYVNIASDARDPIATYFILKNLKHHKISALFMSLDPWIYSQKYYKYRNNYFYLDFNIFQTIRFTFEHDQSAFLQRYKLFFAHFFGEDPQSSEKKSILPKDFGSDVLTQIPKNFKNDPHKLFQVERYGWSNLQFEYLKKIIKFCELNHIQFYNFVPPKRSDFNRLYKVDCAQIHQEYIQKLLKNSIHPKVFGTFDQLIHDGDSLNFVDALHLSERGQKKYTEIFYQLTQSSNQPFQKQYSWFTH